MYIPAHIPVHRLLKRDVNPYSYIAIGLVGVFFVALIVKFAFFSKPQPRPTALSGQRPVINLDRVRDQDIELANPPPPYQPDKLPSYDAVAGDNESTEPGEANESASGSNEARDSTTNEVPVTPEQGDVTYISTMATNSDTGNHDANESEPSNRADTANILNSSEVNGSGAMNEAGLSGLSNEPNESNMRNVSNEHNESNGSAESDRRELLVVPVLPFPTAALTRETRR